LRPGEPPAPALPARVVFTSPAWFGGIVCVCVRGVCVCVRCVRCVVCVVCVRTSSAA
jgi:hypothetical protein